MADVTHILSAIEQGDPQAAEQLLPLVYDELHRLAAEKLAREKPGQTLDTTALLHEAYLRLAGGEQARQWNGRGHFFADAAEAMRRLLVDRARRRRSRKRGGDRTRVDFDEAGLAAAECPDEMLAVDEALAGLAAVDAQAAELVQLRYFAGLSIPEAADPARAADHGKRAAGGNPGAGRPAVRCVLPPHHPGPHRPVGRQPGRGLETPRCVPGRPAPLGMVLPDAALPGRAVGPAGQCGS